MSEFKRCSRGIWDISVPGISFDDDGASNYSKIFDKFVEEYPRGIKGLRQWNEYLEKIRSKRGSGRYDCIIGVSGGTDSSYLLHLAKEYDLKPLAVTLDNGWASKTAVQNIKRVTSALDIDLETYVIDYEEMKDILCSYMKASLPWIDSPTDHAIKSILYKTAHREKLKYILIGHDFRSEGTQPVEWTYGDGKQLRYIQKKFGTKKIRTFPCLSLTEQVKLGYVEGIKKLYPYYYIDYNKNDAQKVLEKLYDWEYYGGHHHENMFTKFAIAYWMRNKFGIDKRLITLSAQVLSGEISREEALEKISGPPYDPERMEADKEYVIKKLALNQSEFQDLWERPNKSFSDYPSYLPMIRKYSKAIKPLVRLVLPQKPAYFVQMDFREDGH